MLLLGLLAKMTIVPWNGIIDQRGGAAGRKRGPLMSRQYIIGVLSGWTLWIALYASAFAVEASETYFPKFLRDADVPDTLGTVLLVAAVPVAAGGWLFIWGDGPQPPEWVTGVPFNVAVGLLLYGALGVIAAAIYARRHKPR